MSKTRGIIYIALFLILILALWAGLSLLPGPQRVHLPADTQGGYDLTAYDFENTIYTTATVGTAFVKGCNDFFGSKILTMLSFG